MSLLAQVLRSTCKFMETKDPVDFKAWSDAYEALCQDELEQVSGASGREIYSFPYLVNDIRFGGGEIYPCPWIMNN